MSIKCMEEYIMITKIRKRDGREDHFIPERITRAIFLAASRVAKEEGTEADYETAEYLTDRVVSLLNKKYKDEVPSVEQVQDAVVKVLIEAGHAKTSEKYILYRQERSNIRNMKSRLMKSISEITFSDSNDSDTKRENANIDGNTAMGTMLQYGSAVSKEFCMSQVMNPEHVMLHDQGDIHVHDMDFMNMGTLTCCQIDLSKLFKNGFSTGHGFLREPQDITSYGALAAIAIQSNQNDQHGGQSVPAFDYYLAPGVEKTFKKTYYANVRKAIELLKGLEVDPTEDLKAIETEHNVYPKIDTLNVEPCRKVIQDAFEDHITQAPGMSHVRDMVSGPIIPTPGAVMECTKLLYDCLDNSKMFKNPVVPQCRSMMNATFRAEDDEINAKFVKESSAAGMSNLKGHRSVGGMRASIYNAMPYEGVEKLVEFMAEFEKNNS